MNARPVLKIGKPIPDTPRVHFWLEERQGDLWLIAKHSDGGNDQNVAVIRAAESGSEIELRRLFDPTLLKALMVEKGETIGYSVEERAEQ